MYKYNQNKNEIIVKYLNESFIDLKNTISSKKVPENEYLNKAVNAVKKIHNFNKQQKGKGLPRILALRPSDFGKCIKILTPKKCFKYYQ